MQHDSTDLKELLDMDKALKGILIEDRISLRQLGYEIDQSYYETLKSFRHFCQDHNSKFVRDNIKYVKDARGNVTDYLIADDLAMDFIMSRRGYKAAKVRRRLVGSFQSASNQLGEIRALAEEALRTDEDAREILSKIVNLADPELSIRIGFNREMQ